MKFHINKATHLLRLNLKCIAQQSTEELDTSEITYAKLACDGPLGVSHSVHEDCSIAVQ